MTESKTTVEGTTGWTVETLKQSVDQRFADNQIAVDKALTAQEKAVSIAFITQEKSVSTALLAAKEAVIKAEILTDKRFDAVTNSVTDLSTQTSNLIPRAEYVANHKALDDKIVVATDAINRSSGDKNLYSTNTFVIQTVNQAIATLKTELETILTPLVKYVANQKGEAQGSQMTVGRFYGAIAAVGTILGIIIVVVGLFSK